MPKIDFRVQLDKSLWFEVQRLIDAGEYNTAAEVVEDALRVFMATFEAVTPEPATLAARTVKGLMAELDAIEREQFEEFVTAYGAVASHAIRDDEMISLLEIFKAYGFRRALRAVHDVQDSKLPLSPSYLETILEKADQQAVERKELTTRQTLTSMNNPTLAEVAVLYEKEIGPLTEKIGEQLIVLVGEFPDLERWSEAFGAAASMNKKNLRYVIGCLRGNGTKKIDHKDTGKRGPAKSERVRTERRKQTEDYYKRWEEKRKARDQSGQK
jgi:Arc/MetJ-type ribon-helix-helix transcriptional regulator